MSFHAANDFKDIASEFTEKSRIASRREKIRLYAPFLVLIALTVIGGIIGRNNHFLSWDNFVNIMYQMSVPLVVATGITFVVLLGSIDLSMEGVIGFTAAMLSLLVPNTANANNLGLGALVLVLLMGALMGLIVGYVHVYLKIASFIASFALSKVYAGFAVMLYRGTPATAKWNVFDFLASSRPLGIPLITWMAFGFFFLGVYVLNYTAFGRGIYAIGYQESIARSAGINVKKTKVLCFMISAVAASFAGILIMIRLKVGLASAGNNQLFPAITAIVVGGASVAGGKGGMLQTFIGVLITTELANLLTLMGVDAYYKQAINAAIIIIAVSFSIVRSRRIIAK